MQLTGWDNGSLKTDLRFAALKFAGGVERRNVGLTRMLSKVHVVDRLAVDKADWLIHREMSCDWLVTDMKGLELVWTGQVDNIIFDEFYL